MDDFVNYETYVILLAKLFQVSHLFNNIIICLGEKIILISLFLFLI